MKKKQKNTKPLTLDDLGKFTDDVLVPKIKKATREDFMEFTDDVLLPAIENIVDDKLDKRFGEHTHEMKSYIDSKLTENKGDIIAYIKGDQERDKNWKIKILGVLKREKIIKPQELKILSDLIR